MQRTIPIQWGSINILLQYQWLYCIIYLLNNGFTNVNNHQQISIHSNHSNVSLSNPICLIIRSNQFAINIEQILIQTIIGLVLSDWSHCHLWMFNVIYDSLEIVIMIMIEMNGWSIETTIIIQYHCENDKEKQHNQAGRIVFW